MPIETILPDATTTPNPAWSGTTDTWPLSTDDSTRTTCSTVGEAFTVSFGNLTSTIGSINSITFSVIGHAGIVRGTTAICTFSLLNSSDSSYGLNENKNFTDATINTTQAGTTRTTSDGSTAWTESDVNGLRMSVKFASITNPSADMNLDFLKIDVDYNAAAAAPTEYNSTTNNIHVSSGNINVISGNVFIE